MKDETRGISIPTEEQAAMMRRIEGIHGEDRVGWREIGPNSVGAIVVEVLDDGEVVAATRVLPGGMTSTAGAWTGSATMPRADDEAVAATLPRTEAEADDPDEGRGEYRRWLAGERLTTLGLRAAQHYAERESRRQGLEQAPASPLAADAARLARLIDDREALGQTS